LSFTYCMEQRRLKLATDNVERKAAEGAAWLKVARSAGLWVQAKGSGPWEDGDSGWSLTDLEFGPYVRPGLKWNRVDLSGWLTLAAPAGKSPSDEIWYRGLRAWSFGVGARAEAIVFRRLQTTPMWVGIDLRYRTNGRSGWVYLPHHSVALADTAGWSGDGVFTWQAGLEFKGERAGLSTGLLWEEPLGAAEIMATKERPFYLVNRAYVRARENVTLALIGEILLSGDDPATSFKTVSLVPRWTACAAVGWDYPL
jgi:hypothetical protein